MITFQENTHFSQALPCTREEFWEQVRKPSTAWRIDARRAILAAVEASKSEGVSAIQNWLNNADYQKFLLKKRGMKKKAAKEAWAKKTDAPLSFPVGNSMLRIRPTVTPSVIEDLQNVI